MVVMHHHPAAYSCDIVVHPRTQRSDDAGGLMSADHIGGAASRSTIFVQVATAHPGRFDLDDHLTWSWERVGKLRERHLFVTQKNHSDHPFLRRQRDVNHKTEAIDIYDTPSFLYTFMESLRLLFSSSIMQSHRQSHVK
jgi:hypothetical protein